MPVVYNSVRFLKREIARSYFLQEECGKGSAFSQYCVGQCQNWRMLIFTAATEIRWWVRSSWSPANCRKYCLVEILLMASVKIQSGAFLPYMGIGQWSQYEMNQRNMGLDLFTTFNFTWHLKERKYCYKLKLKWGITRCPEVHLGSVVAWPQPSPWPDTRHPAGHLISSHRQDFQYSLQYNTFRYRHWYMIQCGQLHKESYSEQIN